MRRRRGTADVVQLCWVAVMAWWARECQGQPWSWIVATPTPVSTNTTSSSSRVDAPPSCPSYCLNALGGDVKAEALVGLWWCQGTRFPNERWSFDAAAPAALSIVNAALTSTFCLDIADLVLSTNRTGSSGLRALFLSNCTPSSPTQRWAFEPGTLRLMSLAPDSNSSSSVYVFPYRPPGQANYYLYLTENTTAAISFIKVDSSVMASYYTPALPQSNDSNLILNGNLELLTTYAPLDLPLDYTFFPNQQVVEGFNFVLCHWAVQGDLTFGNCSSARCQLPAEWCGGSNTDVSLVFLNWQPIPPPPRPGGIMQTVPTYPGSTYLLMFDMRNPFKQMQSLQVSVSPVASSTSGAGSMTQSFQILSNQTDGQTHQFQFTASGNFVNVSFVSRDSTQCGPLISNIQLYYWPEEDDKPPLMPERGNQQRLLVAVIAGWLVAAGCAVVALFLAGKAWHTRQRELVSTTDGMLSCDGQGSALQPKITVYSYEQLKSYTQNFSILIGEGGFGKVYFGQLPQSGLRVAVKRQNAPDDAVSFEMEVELLSRVHHRYLVKFLGYCNDKGERMLVFEYMPNKSLYSRLHAKEAEVVSLSWEERTRIAYQVAYALEYLHHGANPPVLHRDVKSANVLLANTLTARLADLGISKVGRVNEATHWTSTMTVVKGSRGYLDPYYLQTSMISQKSDVYSFGVLLLEVVTGRKAITADLELLTSWVKREYWDQSGLQQGSLAQNVLEAPQENILDACLRGSVRGADVEAVMEIARCCLQEEPRHRPSMVEVTRRLRELLPPHSSSQEDGDVAGRFGDVDQGMGRCSASTHLLVEGCSLSLLSHGR